MEEAILEPSVRTGELIFQHLPGYARHIRDHYLKDYIRCQLKYARELDTPLLKIFGDMPDEQIVEASAPGHSEFLTAAEENTLRQLLEQSMEKWVNDKLEIVARDRSFESNRTLPVLM